MFNSYDISNKNTQIVSTHVNAVTGNITKTYTKSFFKRFNLNSGVAERLFEPTPTLKTIEERTYSFSSGKYESVVFREVQIIQMVVVGDMEVIAEIMFKEDYEEVVGG